MRSSASKTAATWSGRKRGRGPGRVASTREDEQHAEAMAARAKALAPILGWCNACGVSVDEEHGRLHDWDCPDVPAERRRKKS